MEPTSFKYEKPELVHRKAVKLMARTDIGAFLVQVIGSGGENNLHSHAHADGFWFVHAGRVRFYTTDDVVIGEFGPGEGILVPRGYPYWFESVGEQELELLQFDALDRSMTMEEILADRTDHESSLAEKGLLPQDQALG